MTQKLIFQNYLASSSFSDSPNVIVSWDIFWPWRWPLTDSLTFTSHEDIRRKIRLSSCLTLTWSRPDIVFSSCGPRWLETLSGIGELSVMFRTTGIIFRSLDVARNPEPEDFWFGSTPSGAPLISICLYFFASITLILSILKKVLVPRF